MEVNDESNLDLTVEETVVKKRKKKLTEENFLSLPDDVIDGCTPELTEELQISYQLVYFQLCNMIAK